MTVRISGMTIAIYNDQAMTHFYSLVFGIHFKSFDQDGYTLYEGMLDEMKILLCPAKLAKNNTEQNRHQLEIEVIDLEKSILLVTLNGGKLIGKPHTANGTKSAGCYDPDGNSLVLVEKSS